jgi:hypothetical protein
MLKQKERKKERKMQYTSIIWVFFRDCHQITKSTLLDYILNKKKLFSKFCGQIYKKVNFSERKMSSQFKNKKKQVRSPYSL